MPAADAAAPGDTNAAAIGLGYLNDMAFWPNPTGRATPSGSVPFTAEMHRRLEQLGGILQCHRPGPERVQRQWRQDHHLS